jgi:AraC-like DNA-binding protein
MTEGLGQKTIWSICNLFYFCTGIPLHYFSKVYTYAAEHQKPKFPKSKYPETAYDDWLKQQAGSMEAALLTLDFGETALGFPFTTEDKIKGAFFAGPFIFGAHSFATMKGGEGKNVKAYQKSLPRIEIERVAALKHYLELLVRYGNHHKPESALSLYKKLPRIAPIRLDRPKVTSHHSILSQEKIIRNALENGIIDYELIASRVPAAMAKNDMLRSEKNHYIVYVVHNSHAAIRIGVNANLALSYSDELIPLVEDCVSIDEVRALMKRAFLVYYDLVQEAKRGANFSRPIQDLVKFVQRHYMKRLSLSDIAKDRGYNYKYISALFAKETQETFSAFVIRVRIQEALRLLKDNTRSIMDIADEVGFGEPSYFSKRFREITGMSPKEYQKRSFLPEYLSET